MPGQNDVQSRAKTARLIFASYIAGPLLFATVTYVQRRSDVPIEQTWNPTLARTMLGAALVACVLALFLRRLVPARPRDVSADLYWSTASKAALLAWAPLEGAMLASIIVYRFTGSMAGVAIAALALLLLVSMNPWALDRV